MPSLAFETYSDIGAICDRSYRLDLAWTLDEKTFLGDDLDAVVSRYLLDEVAAKLPNLGRYPVQDPFGESILRDAVQNHFHMIDPPPALFAGAGVGSLLAAIAGGCAKRRVQIVGTCYPDFPAWITRCGGAAQPYPATSCQAAPDDGDPATPALVFIERPPFFADDDISRAQLVDMIADLGARNIMTVVDESNANYADAGYSLVAETPRLPLLAVLRGFSKALQLGGLRLGVCVAGARAGAILQEVVPPLLASPLVMAIGRSLLDLGDLTRPLRRRIAQAVPQARTALRQAGVALGPTPHPLLPYVLLDARRCESITWLEAAGIRGKLHRSWTADGEIASYRVSVPLSEERMQALRRRLRDAAG